MLNLSDKRQHFRFPAYDDEIGVKLINNRRKDFLKDVLDDGFIYKQKNTLGTSNQIDSRKKIKSMSIDPVEMVDTPDYFGYGETSSSLNTYVSPKKKTAAFEQKRVTIEQTKKEPEKSEPIKRTIDKINTYVEPTETHYTSQQSTFSNKLLETDDHGNAKYHKTSRNRSKFESSYDLPGAKGKSMFKPKHIPASLIEETDEDEKGKYSRDVIFDELRKAASESMLTIEDEIVLDPITDAIDLPKKNESSAVIEKKKNQRLEKSLSGIIADEGSQKLDSYYFD